MNQTNVSVTPPGQWPSEISTAMVAEGSTRIAEPRIHAGEAYWLESLNDELGRMGIMCQTSEGAKSILPSPFSVRSKVHEYGGNAYCFLGDCIYFVNADDQEIYELSQDDSVTKMTAQPSTRFADLCPHPNEKLIIAVAESHNDDGSVENSLILLNTESSALTQIVEGCDFFAYPRFSPNGDKLAWISWMQPDMPWDATQLSVANFDGGTIRDTETLTKPEVKESIVQPLWRSDTELLFVSDRDNWWNLYSYSLENGKVIPLCKKQAEFATPLWTLGMSNYALLDHDTALVSYTSEGLWHTAKLDLTSGTLEPIGNKLNTFDSFSAEGKSAIMIAAGPSDAAGIWRWEKGQLEQVRGTAKIDPAICSKASIVSYPSASGEMAHAFYYPPHNPNCKSDEPPPLIVLCHGGPTGQSDASLNLKIQFWTSRGFAVADVNYRGSTGYGRNYRQSLYGHWGVKDIEDVEHAALALVKQGQADPQKLIIKGSSAGGYSVLAALAFTDTFKVGVSLYGIGDLVLLAEHTHKFEARYLDQLVGPYPQSKPLYLERSPIHHCDKLDCAMLLFQGLEDKVVPPEQAQLMAQAVREKGLPVCLIEYANEGHGFRSSRNIEHMLDSELSFYQQVLGLGSAGDSAIKIDNL